MLATATLVAPLAAVDATDVAVAGGKGSNLGELVRAGFPVPEGFVVSTALYRAALTSAGIAELGAAAKSSAGPVRLRAAIEAMTLPSQLAAQIGTAYSQLGNGPVAVRSSATAEDLPGAAFAGQQETFLNVIGPEAVLEAVRACWASLWGERAVAYRARLGFVGEPEIAVVVQRMVPSQFAGVLFTANPVTGVRDELVIEASPGLGEAVVSGLVTPDHAVVDRHGRIRQRRRGRREVVIRSHASGGVVREDGNDHDEELPTSVLRELAGLGGQIADHFGRPQDIEWAYADATVWIVQARPLTALPPAPVPANRIQRVSGAMCAELVPTRPYPLDMTSWTVPGWFAILARMFAEIPAVDIDVWRMFPEVDGVVTQLLPPQPRPTWRTLTTPLRVRERLRRFDPAWWTSDPRFLDYERRLGELRRQDHTALGWSDLMTVPGDVLGLLHAYVDLRIDYLPAVLRRVAGLRALLTVLGQSSEFWPLLAGQATRTRAANDELHGLAEQIRHTPAWAQAFDTLGEDDLVATVRDAEPFAALRVAVGDWLEAFGHRETTSAALVSAPTWDDALLVASLRGLVAHPAPPGEDHDQRAAAERRILGRRRVRFTGTGARIVDAADAARTAMAFREDSHFHALRLRPVLRRALVEAGDRLTLAGVLTESDDVFHLRLEELRELPDPTELEPAERARVQRVIRRRRMRRAEFGEAPLISPATLYPGVRRPAADALVSGTPGGGGRATGPVRVIRRPGEFDRLRPGDVLVCPYTNPAWTPLFRVAAAVVADTGSFGSHAAIVAREYGIPAVMGTGNGTQVLSDEMLVTVDGDRGDVVAAARPHPDA